MLIRAILECDSSVCCSDFDGISQSNLFLLRINICDFAGLAAYNGPVIDAFDMQTGELLYTADAHDRPVHFIHLISAGTPKLPVFASCCHGGTIKLIELQTGKILEKVRSTVGGPCYGEIDVYCEFIYFNMYSDNLQLTVSVSKVSASARRRYHF